MGGSRLAKPGKNLRQMRQGCKAAVASLCMQMQNSEGETIRIFLEKIEKERKKKEYQNVKNAGKKSGGGNQSKTSVEGMGKVCWSS